MNIKTDVMGAKIHNNQRIVSENVQKAMNRLSTGLRINSAKDDAAGLAISERLLKNIKGNRMSSNNIDDGINLLKTGQSSLSIIQDHLQRIRELTIQMQNGTYSQSDRDATQIEVDQMLKSINHIAINTNFNDLSILNKGGLLKLGGASAPGYVRIPSRPQYDFGTGEFSYSVRFKMNSLTGPNQILNKRGVGNIELQTHNNDKLLAYFAGPGGSPTVLSTTSLEIDKWYEVTLTRKLDESTGNMIGSMYINGELEPQTVVSNYNVNSTTPLSIGRDGTSGVEYADATIDNVRLYNKGLTPSEVEDLNRGYIPREGLVGEWLFNDGSGTVAKDTSSYGNDGTVVGTADWSGENSDLSLHTGSEPNNTKTLQLLGSTTTDLNIDGLNVNDANSLNKLDQAIEKISSFQTNFGTAQNALEYRKEYTENSTIQLEQSKSRIKDIDMASASSQLLQNQIKLQTSIQMLQRNNTNRESITSLLTG